MSLFLSADVSGSIIACSDVSCSLVFWSLGWLFSERIPAIGLPNPECHPRRVHVVPWID